MKKILPVMLLFLFSACVSNTDFYRLKMEVDDVKKNAASEKTEVAALKEQAAVTVKEDSFSAVRESQADMTSRVNSLSSGLKELQGSFEENRFAVEKKIKDADADREVLRARVSALEENLEKKLKESAAEIETLKAQLSSPGKEFATPQEKGVSLEGPGQRKPEAGKLAEPSAKEEIPEQKTGAAAPAASQEKKTEGDAGNRAYDAAYEAFKDKKYKEAREKFAAFVRDYPKNELTDNAQFWIGETHYAEKSYEDAILAYETLLKKYPDSQKTSGALLKQGYSFIEINDARTGRIILNRLIEKFPDSKDAELARKKIAEMDKKNSRKK